MPKALTIAPQRRFVRLDQLNAPIDGEALAHFRTALLKRWPEADGERGGPLFWVGMIVVGALALGVVLLPAGLGISLMLVAPFALPVLLGSLAISALIGWPIGLWMRRFVRRELAARGGWKHWYRLTRFAALNDLSYLPSRESFGPTSLVFSALGPREYRDAFIDQGATRLQFGNRIPWKHFGLAGAGEAAWCFLTIELQGDSGRMLLRPRRRRPRFINLVPSLPLPSDVSRRFTLNVTEGADTALEVITPRLVRLLAERLPGAFVEIAGAQLILTAAEPWRFGDQRTWRLIEEIVDAVPTRATRRSDDTSRELVPVDEVPPRAGFITPPKRVAVAAKLSAAGIAFFVLVVIAQIVRAILQP
jgi:hypothetical protein